MPGVTLATLRVTGTASVSTSLVEDPAISTAANTGEARQTLMSAGMGPTLARGPPTIIRASRSGSLNGAGRRSRASTMVNIAVAMPMARANRPDAAMNTHGRRTQLRTAYRPS
jgi:hypothetical protein